jgi:hypothetical protein
MDPEADPAIFIIELQDANIKLKIKKFLLILVEGTFASFFKKR